jgi:outer membrane protein OmpA-like peptidoglycan-associated protein
MTSIKKFIYSFIFSSVFIMSFLFPVCSWGAENTTTAIAEAKAALEQALSAGAEKYAPNDLAQARSWLSQAEKKRDDSKSIFSRTVHLVKSDEEGIREIHYMASMATAKARTAEAKARKISVMAELKDVRKDLAEHQSSLDILKKKLAESEAVRTAKAKIEADRKAIEQAKQKSLDLEAQKQKELEESRKKAAALEAQKLKELEEAQKKTAELDALKQRELAQAKLAAERLSLQKKKEDEEIKAREAQLAIEKKKLDAMQKKIAAMEREKAMQSDAAKIPHANVKSTDKEMMITLLAIDILTTKNTVSTEGKVTLEKVGALLKQHAAGAKIVIRGHTDSTGKTAAKKSVSEKRAKEVKQYLVTSVGIPSTQLSAEGLGSTQSVASNASEAGRAMNRRVEIIVPLAQ